jgi:hypothetical protein
MLTFGENLRVSQHNFLSIMDFEKKNREKWLSQLYAMNGGMS